VHFVKSAYYLEPEAIGRKAFYLLKSVLRDERLSAICKIVIKDREALAAIDPFQKTMLLSTLYWPDEIRATDELDLPEDEQQFKPAELEMARSLVAAMTADFDASQYHDEYREALLKVIEAKVAGEEVERPAEAPAATGKLVDLMSVLEASVAAARATKAGEARAEAAAGTAKPETAKPEKLARASGKTKRAGAAAKAVPEAAAVDEAAEAAIAAAPARRRKSA